MFFDLKKYFLSNSYFKNFTILICLSASRFLHIKFITHFQVKTIIELEYSQFFELSKPQMTCFNTLDIFVYRLRHNLPKNMQ